MGTAANARPPPAASPRLVKHHRRRRLRAATDRKRQLQLAIGESPSWRRPLAALLVARFVGLYVDLRVPAAQPPVPLSSGYHAPRRSRRALSVPSSARRSPGRRATETNPRCARRGRPRAGGRRSWCSLSWSAVPIRRRALTTFIRRPTGQRLSRCPLVEIATIRGVCRPRKRAIVLLHELASGAEGQDLVLIRPPSVQDRLLAGATPLPRIDPPCVGEGYERLLHFPHTQEYHGLV